MMNTSQSLKKRLSRLLPISLISAIGELLTFDKEVELIIDNCPPTFDFTEAGNVTVEEIDQSILVMERINRVDSE
jgi:hypothetical protein